jgi:hypothetical protein
MRGLFICYIGFPKTSEMSKVRVPRFVFLNRFSIGTSEAQT